MGKPVKVVVVGAGLSGLAAAFALKKHFQKINKPLELTLLERSNRTGGSLLTESHGGFLIEAGPTGFLDPDGILHDLARDLGISEEIVESSRASNKRFIIKNGRPAALPMNPVQFITSPILSVQGRLRMFAEPFLAKKDPETVTLAEWGRNHFGDEAVKMMLDPMASGVFAGDAEKLSFAAAFPRIAQIVLPHRSVLAGMAQTVYRRKFSKKPRYRLSSFIKGMSQIPSALEKNLGAGILKLNTSVQSIKQNGTGWTLTALEGNVPKSYEADHLILAVPSDAAARMLDPLSPALAEQLQQIPYASVAVVALGYRRQDILHPLDGFGALVPRAENLRPLGVLFDSSVFQGRAPQDHVLLRLMVGGRQDPSAMDLKDEDLISLAQEFVGKVLGSRGNPVLQKIYRWPGGIAQYETGHLERVAGIEREAQKFPTLHLCGASYRGVSTPLAARDGLSAAADVLMTAAAKPKARETEARVPGD